MITTFNKLKKPESWHRVPTNYPWRIVANQDGTGVYQRNTVTKGELIDLIMTNTLEPLLVDPKYFGVRNNLKRLLWTIDKNELLNFCSALYATKPYGKKTRRLYTYYEMDKDDLYFFFENHKFNKSMLYTPAVKRLYEILEGKR